MPTNADPKVILLVEDNRGDIRLIQEALKSSAMTCEMVIARDGIEAMNYLQQSGETGQPNAPDLILLDLNLPRKDGREVLAEIKSNPALMHIPVVVLSTSRNEDDILKSYDLNVNCYISKSRNLSELFKIVRGIEEFWLETTALPVALPTALRSDES
jgi:chemotaxis family two-component system response regulator Rcp1